MYRTNWGIGHSMKEILEAHKGPFTGEGHKGLYEILTTSWHAQLAINLAMMWIFNQLLLHIICMQCLHIHILQQTMRHNFLYLHIICGLEDFVLLVAAAHGAIFMVQRLHTGK
jgi:photosystem I P700 chlorophyll a apoprotein A1